MRSFDSLSRVFLQGLPLIVACMLVSSLEAAPVNLPSDLDLVQRSNGNFISFRPADLLQGEIAKQMPAKIRRNILGEIGPIEEKLGIRLADMERLTVLSLPPVEDPVVLVTTTRPYDAKAVRERVAPNSIETTYRGQTLYGANDVGGVSFCPINASIFLVGNSREIRKVLDAVAAKSEPLLSDAIALAVKGHHIVIGTRPEAIVWLLVPISAPAARGRVVEEQTKPDGPAPDPNRGDDVPKLPPPPGDGADPFQIAYLQPAENRAVPTLDEMLELMGPMILPFKPLFQAKTIAIGFTPDLNTSVEWKLSYTNEARAADGENAMRTLLYVIRESIPMLAREVFRHEPRESPELFVFYTQIQAALRATPIQREGTNISAKILLMVKPPTLTAVFTEMTKTILRDNTSNNLKQIAIAMHIFMDAHGAMPTDAIYSKAGKPLLSWRVAILPYLEQEALYKQFKLDEPWDSPHNKKLLAKMPKLYKSANSTSKISNATHFRVYSGPGTAFDPKRMRLGNPSLGSRPQDFQDGFSNSFLVVEAAEAVPWTKPEPLAYDPNKALPKVGGLFPGGFYAVFADGSVHFFKMEFPPKDMHAMITIQDGIVVDWEKSYVNPPRRNRDFGVPHERAVPPTQVKPALEPIPDRR